MKGIASSAWRVLLTAILLTGSSSSTAQGLTLVAEEGGGPPVARVVKGIIGYTHWPVEPDVVQLCIVGKARYQDRLVAGMQQSPGRAVRVQRVTVASPAALRMCNAVYLGEGAAADGKFISPPGQYLLIISERDPACRGGGMFCLNIGADRVSFDLNLDSVARSGLRVDPKALMLGRTAERLP